MTALSTVLRGGWDLALPPAPTVPRDGLLADLGPPTFTHPEMPPCWGRAFENYATFAEYLTPHPDDARLAPRLAPLEDAARALLTQAGLDVRPLTTDGAPWPTSNLRRADIPAGSTMLHLDDLTWDGTWKPDFALPDALRDGYSQSLLLLWLDTTGDARLRSYDRLLDPSLDAHRLPNRWQLADNAVTGVRYRELVPRTGTFALTPCRYLHDVLGGAVDATWWLWSAYVLLTPDQRTAYLYI